VEKFAGRKIETAVERRVKALAPNLMKPKTGIGAGDGFKKLPAPIGRLAVEDDRFPIGERLFEQGVDSRLEKFARVERGQQDRYFGSVHVTGQRKLPIKRKLMVEGNAIATSKSCKYKWPTLKTALIITFDE
jgi:hypothetical protein